MGWLVLLLAATVAALFDHGPLALWPVAPSATVALAAWAGVDSGDRTVLIRVWLIGLVADAVDPASTVFHTGALLALTLAFLPLRRIVFRRSLLAWTGWAALMVPLLALVDVVTGGHPPVGGWSAAVAGGVLTAALVLPLGLLGSGLPPSLHPLGASWR